jgi:hypothetical protein
MARTVSSLIRRASLIKPEEIIQTTRTDKLLSWCAGQATALRTRNLFPPPRHDTAHRRQSLPSAPARR